MIDWKKLYSNAYPWQGKMPIMEISGGPYEMGKQHGEICKPQVKKVANDFVDNLAELTGVTRSKLIAEAGKYEKEVKKQTGEEYIEEMKGLAHGADVDYEEVLVLNCGWDLLNSLPTPETHPDYMCSSFSASDKFTRSGNVVCGHNDDGSRNIDQFLVLMKGNPEKGNKFVAPVVPGYIGYHRMWNDRGNVLFGLSLENGPRNDEFAYNVPMWILQRYLIQYRNRADEILNGLSDYPPPTAFNFLISDVESNVYICHATAKHQVSFSRDNSVSVLTNHAKKDEIKPYLVMRDHPSSTDYRFKTVSNRIEEEKGHIDIETGKKALGSHYDSSTGEEHPSPDTPCSHHEYDGKLAGTVSTVLIEMTEDELSAHVSLGNPCEGRWIEDVLPIK